MENAQDITISICVHNSHNKMENAHDIPIGPYTNIYTPTALPTINVYQISCVHIPINATSSENL